jgi:translation initiation factor IF-1
MASDDNIDLNGTVVEVMPAGKFVIDVDGDRVLGHLSGKMRMNKIRIVLGDEVTVQVSPYDPSIGRITRRGKYPFKK